MKAPFGRLFRASDPVKQIPVEEIEPSPYQPRSVFQNAPLEELCQTIRVHGVIQPIVVRKKGKKYELIAGERRLRAVKKLKMATIPAVIKEMSDSQAASIALIENLQREELTAIEEARAYQQLIEIHQLTQESLAQRLGKSQSTIANKLRLLQLPESIQQHLLDRKMTERHARALLALKDSHLQEQVAEEILAKKLTVKQTEERIRKLLAPKPKRVRAVRKAIPRDLRIAVNTIHQSINMIKESGVEVETNEYEHEHFWELVIRIAK